MLVGTHPHVIVVGTGNPIAMLGVARVGSRRGELTTAIRGIKNCRENYVRRAFKNGICTLPSPRSPARIFRYYFFSQLHSIMFRRPRRRSGGGPGGGCARMPVVTYLSVHAVGASKLVPVPCLTR
jgi:hypothetical protein